MNTTTPRKAKPSDFEVKVDGVGTFKFGKRTFQDEIDVQLEYARIIQGVIPTQWLQAIGGALADLRTLTVSAPAGWSIEDMDPADPETFDKLLLVVNALREKERSFRPGPKPGMEASGASAG